MLSSNCDAKYELELLSSDESDLMKNMKISYNYGTDTNLKRKLKVSFDF